MNFGKTTEPLIYGKHLFCRICPEGLVLHQRYARFGKDLLRNDHGPGLAYFAAYIKHSGGQS